MELKEAIQLLKDYNHWRRYDGEINESPKMPNPKEIGISIDLVVSKFENLFISGVSNRRELLITTLKEYDLGYIQGFKDEEWLADKVIEVINCC